MGARLTIRVPGETYAKWYIDATRLRNRSQVTVTTYRDEQYYFWTADLPRSAVRIRPNLSGLSIHTGTQLGDLGSIDLEMTHDGHHDASVERCEKSHEVLYKIRRARGRVDGTVALTPGLTGMPVEVAATRERVRLSRFLITSNECSSHHQRCFPNEDLEITDGANDLYAGVRYSWLALAHESADGNVVQTWYTQAFDRSVEAITRTPTQLTLDAQDFGPLLSGSLVFDKVGSTEPVRHGACVITEVSYAFASGSLDANFDAGLITLTGSDLEATLQRARRP